MMRPVFTFHETTDRLAEHWTSAYSKHVEHVALVMSIVHEDPRSFVGYWVLDVPNSARRKKDGFAIKRKHLEREMNALFPHDPPDGVLAGLVAVMHTHPCGSSVMPSRNDLHGLMPYTLGVVCAVGRKTTRWYDCKGIIARPPAVAPHPTWRLPITERIEPTHVRHRVRRTGGLARVPTAV